MCMEDFLPKYAFEKSLSCCSVALEFFQKKAVATLC